MTPVATPSVAPFRVNAAVAKRSRYTPEIRAEAVRRYREGQKIAEIAQDLDIPPSNITYWLERSGEKPNRRAMKPTGDLTEQLVERYFSLERRIEELGAIRRSHELAMEEKLDTLMAELASLRKLLARRK